jgi:hypothetical protein
LSSIDKREGKPTQEDAQSTPEALIVSDQCRIASGAQVENVNNTAAAALVSLDLEKARAELRKLEQEIAKLNYENKTAPQRELWQRIFGVVSPFVTFVTVVGGLWLTVRNFDQSEKARSEAETEARWQEARKSVSLHEGLSSEIVELRRWLEDPKYHEHALDAAVKIMANATDIPLFENNFRQVFGSVNRDNFKHIVTLDRELGLRVLPIWSKVWDPKLRKEQTGLLNDRERQVYNYTNYALDQITVAIGSFLRQPRKDGLTLDLSKAFLRGADWRDIDLGDVGIEGTRFALMSLEGAKLSSREGYSNIRMDSTAWWQAKTIGGQLLGYLEKECRYVKGEKYGPRDEEFSDDAYNRALIRLRAEGQPK